jgi:hypothetical protein
VSRLTLAAVFVAGTAHAGPGAGPTEISEEIGDQAIGAEVGVATGGHVTPGGLRVVGHYQYQLSDQDWFDGAAAFTFGGGGAECFRDRSNSFVCTHGLTDGEGVEISANVRRYFSEQNHFRPFLRLGIGVALVRFPDDGVSGVAFPLHGGAGIRAQIADSVAVTAQGELEIGFGVLNKQLGLEPQLGAAIVAGAEFRLR